MRLVSLFAACLLATPLFAEEQNPAPAQPAPCTAVEYRQFDFWIGEWEVFDPAGQRVGENRIESILGGCVLKENWTSASANRGESFNIFDARRQVWHQTWVDNSGSLLQIEGGLRDGNMVLSQQVQGADGQTVTHRITWTPNADGSVRQHWQSKTGDADWQTLFDGLYRKKSG